MEVLLCECHPLTDCFVVSQLLSVARHARCLKLGSKPDLTLRQLDIPPHSQFQYIYIFVCGVLRKLYVNFLMI